MCAVRALVEHDAEDFAAFLGDLVHFAHLFGVNARRLFDERMNAVLQGLHGQRRMQIMRRGDDHGIYGAGN